MTTIYFTKRFTAGTLKGISVIQSASFPRIEQCVKFAQLGKKGEDVLTKDPWIITDRSFQNYAR